MRLIEIDEIDAEPHEVGVDATGGPEKHTARGGKRRGKHQTRKSLPGSPSFAQLTQEHLAGAGVGHPRHAPAGAVITRLDRRPSPRSNRVHHPGLTCEDSPPDDAGSTLLVSTCSLEISTTERRASLRGRTGMTF